MNQSLMDKWIHKNLPEWLENGTVPVESVGVVASHVVACANLDCRLGIDDAIEGQYQGPSLAKHRIERDEETDSYATTRPVARDCVCGSDLAVAMTVYAKAF